MMLMSIARMGNGVSQKELADELNISPAAVAKAMKKLECDAMIMRSSSSGDARQNEIVITDKGKAIVDEWFTAEFEGGRHIGRIEKISLYEQNR